LEFTLIIVIPGSPVAMYWGTISGVSCRGASVFCWTLGLIVGVVEGATVSEGSEVGETVAVAAAFWFSQPINANRKINTTLKAKIFFI
jgi:hypothetical protein